MPADNRPSTDSCMRKSALDKSTKVVNTINTGYLGQCKVVQDSTSSRYLLMKEMVYNGEDEFVSAVQFIQLQKAIRDDGLLYIIDYSAEKVQNFCSSFFNLRVYLLPHLEELRKLIKEREKTKEGLTEKEMTYSLFHLIQGLAELHKAGLTHKQITPESVDTTNLVGRNPKLIFIEDGSSTNVKQVAYNAIFRNKDLFLAPEIFEKAASLVKPSSGDLQFDEQKLDAFSLGMTLLYAGVGHSVQDCYDTKAFKFNSQKLDGYLNEFKSKYAINPMITEAVEKLLDLNVNIRASAVLLQTELPRLEEINQYFEVLGDDNMQGDYNDKFPLTPEDRAAGERAKAYLISKNKMYKPAQSPQPGIIQAAGNPGAAAQHPYGQEAGKQGFQPGPTADPRPGQGSPNFGVAGAAQTNGYSPQVPPRQGMNQPAPQYNQPLVRGDAFFESQFGDRSQQNQTGPNSSIQQRQPSYGNLPYQNRQPDQSLVTPYTGAQGQNASRPIQPSQSYDQNTNNNPLMNFMYPGSQPQRPLGQNDQQPISVSEKPLASKALPNQQGPAAQDQGAKPVASTRAGAPVMANHGIFGRPPQQQPSYVQQPVGQTQPSEPSPAFGSNLPNSGMKRSASQPIRIGTLNQSEASQTPAVQQPAPLLGSRPVTYSHSNLHGPYIPAQTRVSDNTYSALTFNPMVVSRPQVNNVVQSNSGILSGSRVRSSSHNIIRNGVVVDVDNPSQEIRASRIVISGNKVDYYMDDSAQRTVTAPTATFVQQAPPVVQHIGYSRPISHYVTNPQVRTSHQVISPVQYVSNYNPSPVVTSYPFVSAPRTYYGSGTPVRYGGYPLAGYSSVTTAGVPVPGSFTYGHTVGPYIGATPRRVTQGPGAIYTTPRSVQKYTAGQPYDSQNKLPSREELMTPRNEQQMARSDYVTDLPSKTFAEQDPTKQTKGVSKKEDSDIKPRELGSVEEDQPRINSGDTLGKNEPNWTDN